MYFLPPTSAFRRLCLLLLFFCFTLPAAFAQLPATDTVCTGEVVTYSVPYSATDSYLWTALGGTSYSPNVNEVVVTWGAEGPGKVTVLINGTTLQVTDVTIGPIPEPQIVSGITVYCSDTLVVGGEGDQPGGDDGEDRKDEQPCISVCDSSTVTYYTAYNSGSTYQWIVDADTISTSTNMNGDSITIHWGGVGFGLITVIETNLYGCVDSSLLCIEIIESPTAILDATPSPVGGVVNICLNDFVYFYDQSLGDDLDTWEVFYGDGDNDYFTTTPPYPFSHQYTSAGTYTATMVVTNGCGCSDTTSLTIEVDSLPGPKIECASVVCAGDTAEYCTPDGCGNNSWTIQGGTIIGANGPDSTCIDVVWGSGSSGPGVLTLDIGGCAGFCSQPANVVIPIVPNSVDIIGPDTVCIGSAATFSVPKIPGANYTWNYNIGNQHLQFNGPPNEVLVGFPCVYGSFNPVLEVVIDHPFLNCKGVGVKKIFVFGELFVIGNKNQACEGDNVNVIARKVTGCTPQGNVQSQPANVDWDVTDPSGTTTTVTSGTSINYVFNSGPGVYEFTAVAQPGHKCCNERDSWVVNVVAAPAPPSILGEDTVCKGSTHQYFVDPATAGSSYSWGIDNGSFNGGGSGTSVSVTWDNMTGSGYQLWVYEQTAGPPTCRTDTFFYDVDTIPPITISGPDTVCPNGTFVWSSSLTDPDLFYDWSISDPLVGSVVSGQGTPNASIEFTNTALLTQAYIILSIPNCETFLDSIPVIVRPVPPGGTGTDTICDGSSLSLNGPTGSGWLWTNDIGQPAIASQNITVSDQANYTLTYQDLNGCFRDTTVFVRVLEVPIASISTGDPTQFCDSADFTSATLVAVNGTVAGDPYQFQWKLNSTPISGATSSTYVATQFGIYTVCVSANGCEEVSLPIAIQVIPCDTCQTNETIAMSYTPPMCNPMTFTGVTSGGVITAGWSFGDGTGAPGVPGGTSTVTHTYSEPGIYIVKYGGTAPSTDGLDTCGIEDQLVVTIPVVAEWEFLVGCPGDSSSFFNLSRYLPGATIVSHSWTFGDGGTSTVQDPKHLYASPGSYPVTYAITVINPATGDLCTATFDQTIDVFPLTAAFTVVPNPICENQPAAFTAAPNPDIIFWDWDFGDGSGSLAPSPNHAYSPPGTYTAKLTVTDLSGCTATDSVVVTVVPEPVPGPITGDTIICRGDTAFLTAPGGGPGYHFVWNTGDTTQTIATTIVGDYFVQITDPAGCVYFTDPVQVIVNEPPFVNVLGQQVLCEGDQLNFGASLSPFTFCFPPTPSCPYQWYFNGAPISGATTYFYPYPGPIFATVGNSGTYALEYTGPNGCVGRDSIDLTVYPVPAMPDLQVVGPTPLCAGEPTTLSVINYDPNCTYQWSNGATGQTITTTQPGNYSVTCVGPGGCSAESKVITVHPLPDVACVISGCYTFPCGTDSVIIPGLPGFMTYEWLEIDALGNCVPAPGVNYTQNYITYTGGAFKLVLTSYAGCVDTSAVIMIDIEPCACDGTYAIAEAVTDSTFTDSCCYYVSIVNDFEDNYFTAVQFVATNANISYSDIASGYTDNSFSSTQVTITPTSGFIPETTIDSLVVLCFSGNATSPVEVLVNWYDTAYGAVCTDTLYFDCPPDPQCISMLNDSIYCDEGNYVITFSVENHSAQTIEAVAVNVAGTGAVVTPNPIAIPPLAPNSIYGPISVTINPGTLMPGDTLCFTLTAHNDSVPDDATFCCSDSIVYCFELPDCPPCGQLSVSATGNPFDCCYDIAFNNPTTYAFDGLITTVVTPGVTINAVNNPLPSPWSYAVNGGSTEVVWTQSGMLPASGTLPNICLDPGNSSQQTVLVTWFAIDAVGDTLTCTDTLELQCPSSCVGIVSDSLYCDTNGYHYDFEVYNNTGYTINQFDFFNLVPGSATISPAPIYPSIPDGTTASFTVDIAGVVEGDVVCFNIRASDQTSDMDLLNCCVSDSQYCLTMPPCDTCQISILADGPTTICQGDTVTLCADYCCDSILAVTWHVPYQTNIVVGDCVPAFATGQYIVAVECLNGPTELDTIDVVVNPNPLVLIGVPVNICENSGPSSISGVPAGGTYSGTGIDPVTGNFNPAVLGAGSHPVGYSYTNPATGCTSSASGNLVIGAVPAVNVDDQSACTNDAAFVIPHTPTGGTFGGSVPGLNNATGVFDPSAASPGVYNFTYSYTSSGGCTGVDSASITVYAAPICFITVSPQPDTGWVGLPNTIYTNFGSQCVTLEGSTGTGYSYSWSNGATTQSQSVCPTVTTTYTLTVTTQEGCTQTCETTICVIEGCDVQGGTNNGVLMCRTNLNNGTTLQGCVPPGSVQTILNLNGVWPNFHFDLGPCDNPCEDPNVVGDPVAVASISQNTTTRHASSPQGFIDPEHSGEVRGNNDAPTVAGSSFLPAMEGIALAAQPNPFSGNTNIVVTSPTDQRIRLEVLTVSGQQVALLLDQRVEAGVQLKSEFSGEGLAAGMYICKLTTEQGDVKHLKLMLTD